MKSGLNVNTDGAAGSYTPGNHGYTYLNNGVNLIGRDGNSVSCKADENKTLCNDAWRDAAAGDFGPGTPEFCVFAIEVEPYVDGGRRETCERSDSRFVVGNGRGRPRFGPAIPHAGGGAVIPYLSTTALTHMVNGHRVALDAAAIPALVVPRSQGQLLGALVWARYRGRSSFAIVGDSGPSYSEGTIALHQMLRWGEIGPVQPVGPILAAARCGPSETALRYPYQSRPDAGDEDRCRAGYHVSGNTDIRAYVPIDSGVDILIFPDIRPPMSADPNDHNVTEEVSLASLQRLAERNGLGAPLLNELADCLR